jgi:hypothetical protein
VVGVIALAALAILGPVWYLNKPSPTPTVSFGDIANPTSTPNPTPTAETSGSILTPTATSEAIEEGSFIIGELVEVFGTGGDGLRVRESPGTRGNILFLGYEGEVFIVQAGPIEQDGRTWWYIVDPYSSSRNGWAAADYLHPLESQ